MKYNEWININNFLPGKSVKNILLSFNDNKTIKFYETTDSFVDITGIFKYPENENELKVKYWMVIKSPNN